MKGVRRYHVAGVVVDDVKQVSMSVCYVMYSLASSSMIEVMSMYVEVNVCN